tara:strand:- start:551 stop:1765 length:1215 start_codon:yes stop_codon:yes gene_type:complete
VGGGELSGGAELSVDILLRAQSLFRGGSLQQAAELLEAHMACKPEDFRVAVALGRVYRSLQQPERAAYWLRYSLQSFQALPELDEEDIEYFYEEAREEDGFDPDHEYGADVGKPEAANDDDSQRKETMLNTGSDDEGACSHLANTPDSVQGDDSEQYDHLREDSSDPHDKHESEEEGLEALYSELDLNDFGQEDELDLLPNRLTRREKAEGAAAEIAVEAGWLKKDMDILVEVLSYHRSHGKTKSALLELLIEKEVTPGELILLHDIRLLWPGGGYNRVYRREKAEEGWPNISWQLGLRLIRGLRVDSSEEALLFVEDCFEDWGKSRKHLSSFPIFTRYLDHVLEHMEMMSKRCGQMIPSYIEYELFEDSDGDYKEWYEPRFRNGYRVGNVIPGREGGDGDASC